MNKTGSKDQKWCQNIMSLGPQGTTSRKLGLNSITTFSETVISPP